MPLNLLQYAQRNAEPDEKVIPISTFCVMRLYPDGSALLYKNQTGRLEQIVLSRHDLEFIKGMSLPVRQFTPGPEEDKDVHTEHCCVIHGCKYGAREYRDTDCPVETGKKKQSHACERCQSDAEDFDQSGIYATKHVIAKIIETCGGCPAQWSARTEDGKYIYIRYRHGCFRVEVDGNTVLEDEFVSVYGGDGVLTYEELVSRTAGVLDFSKAKWVETREEVEG